MPNPNFEKQVEELGANLTKIGDQIKSAAEETNKQIKASGEMHAETRDKVDKLLLEQGALQARLQEAEQKLLKGPQSQQEEREMSIGERVATDKEMEGLSSSFRGSRRVQMPRSAITSATGSGSALVRPDRMAGIIGGPERRLTIRDLIAPGETESNSVEYVKETGFTNNAAPVAENTGKPYSEITFGLVQAGVRTIAHLFKASRQILDDAKQLQSFINARAEYGLMIKEELQLLYGNNTGANLHGIIPQASAYVKPTGAAVVDEQHIDRIRLALLQAALAEYAADGIVLNPIDWAVIEMLKDSNKNYLIGKPQGQTAPTLWNRPVVETQSIVQNEFLVGAFKMGAQIYDRMDIEVLISTENDKDFENNMVTIRAEERLALAVYRPEAFVTGDFTFA
ncbi:phage major capsid protein [Shewanella baltica]|uniref:phage major capsid protein n=1 Tax=Shewanella baltica TaxID=62322 RepID=UPI00217E7951|nr:phage major capsid protein [Shewanella baltica]MCS6126682.1 phage major capsid protein [Shewanella baltica]MCS6138755.1 phage major capsid protein [Shewanella baltica]MCS6144944.1 phage major capsid protein [Shewanella baltica]MCS6169474.1 phage major capsid protein [Shewanella baltica]MCS6186698.1 phage major capsid protein [Shewanella baltica]